MKSRIAWTLVLLVLSGTVLTVVGRDRPRAEPRPLAHSVRQQSDARAENCSECHAEIVESLRNAPHTLTLRRPSEDQLMARFAGREVDLGGRTFRFEARGNRLWFSSSAHDDAMEVDWIFGSGHHALTPVSMNEGPRGETEFVQLHVTCYANQELGVTPGSENLVKGAVDLGIHHKFHEIRECFSCHASLVPFQGEQLDQQQLVPGVRCGRCHSQTASHVASSGATTTTPDWRGLTARESIQRCGECHRRPDQFTADELHHGNKLLLRFAPVGMAMSACFRANEDPAYAGKLPRYDCLTCHDPHQPATSDVESYVEKCAGCHRHSPAGLVRNCSLEPDGTRCLSCHMPKVEVLKHLSFTDHWVRVRKPAAE